MTSEHFKATKLYLLCGKVGAGKSTYARQFEEQGVVRLSQDEITLAKAQGFRDPNNYMRVLSEELLRAFENEARKEILQTTIELLAQGRSVVIDDGFWREEERQRYTLAAKEAGAEVTICYFPVDEGQQWLRLQERNKGDFRDYHYISHEDMVYLNQFFEPPSGPNVVVISHN